MLHLGGHGLLTSDEGDARKSRIFRGTLFLINPYRSLQYRRGGSAPRPSDGSPAIKAKPN
jgi:hypothetical protein